MGENRRQPKRKSVVEAGSIQYDREITFRGCQISGLNWISSNAPILSPPLASSIHAEMNFESRGIHSFFDPPKIPARGEDSRPEVEQVVARKNSESSFRASIFLCLLRNQLGWRELSRSMIEAERVANCGNRAKRINDWKEFQFLRGSWEDASKRMLFRQRVF